MFTGIVQRTVPVAAIEPNAFGVRLSIDCSNWQAAGGYKPALGDSICVSGVCLTVSELVGRKLGFDVIAQTLSLTTLGELAVGGLVNIEPAVLPTQPLGGHFMQGHVDGVGKIVNIYDGEDEWRSTISPPTELMDYIVPKGSVAIDGVSLTIAQINEAEQTFEVALIPTTLELTTLGQKCVGDKVNLEADIISKSVVHVLRRMQGGGEGSASSTVTMAMLADAGFVSGSAKPAPAGRR